MNRTKESTEGDEEHGPKPPSNIIERFKQICASGWFFGAVDTQLAEKKLKGDRGLKKGTFMVRDSSNKTCFTITKVAKDKNDSTSESAKHSRIIHCSSRQKKRKEE